MPTECNRDSFDFGTVERRQVVGAFDGGTITSDAGALLLGQTDKAIRLVSRLADGFQDGRNPALVVHQLPEMLRQRIYGIVLGYEDIVDHHQRAPRESGVRIIVPVSDDLRPCPPPAPMRRGLSRLHRPELKHRKKGTAPNLIKPPSVVMGIRDQKQRTTRLAGARQDCYSG